MPAEIVSSVAREVETKLRRERDYSELLKDYDLASRLEDPYLVVGNPPKERGWVVHITIVKRQFLQMLEAVLPLLAESGACFKIPCDETNLGKFLDGSFGQQELGKIVCIYPEKELEGLAKKLIKLTEGHRGPAIPTDRHLGGCVCTNFEVYGFSLPENMLPFRADPSVRFRKPKGVRWPFAGITQPKVKRAKRFLNGKYLLVQLLKGDVKGSVYKAVDFSKPFRPEWCVIKEGKSAMCSDAHGRDIKDRLAAQFRLHQELSGESPVAKARELFEENGNFFLVLEFIEGVCLNQRLPEVFGERKWAGLKRESKLELLGWLLSILDILDKLHGRGYIHRDFTPENFMIVPGDKVWLIDLELMWKSDDYQNPPFRLGTPGFISPEQWRGDMPGFTEDIYGAGALMIALLTGLAPEQFGINDPEKLSYQLSDQLQNRSIAQLIAKCLSRNPRFRPLLQDIRSAIALWKQQI